MVRVVLNLVAALVIAGSGMLSSLDSKAEGPHGTDAPVKLGALMPLTGEFAMASAAFLEGMRLAEDEVNRAGGIKGRRLAIVVEDTQYIPSLISAAALKLISVDHVTAAITTAYGETNIGGTLFERAHIPSLALWDSSPEIDAMGEYVFAIGPWTPSDAEVSASFARNQLFARKAVVITSVEPWSELVGRLFADNFVAKGGSVAGVFHQNPGDSDFRSLLAKTRSLEPDIVYAPLASEIIAFHKQRRAAGLAIPVISSGVISDEHLLQAEGALEGVYQSQIGDPERPQVVDLRARYQAKYGKRLSMPWYVATGFDAVQLYAYALREVGDDPVKLKDFLYTVRGFPGAAQEISISAGGSSPYFVKMFLITNGEFREVLR